MSEIIQVENLSKKYIIGHQQLKGKKTIREAISQKFANLGNKLVHPFSKNIAPNSPYEEFWALKDINFEAEQGDRIGIIGRNGAGKSTLLKVLSRITEPTSGKITLKGRVASLLEVGTGFNGELTGRENIFLNGAILGMRRAEIKQKFDEIVDFSGVEKFLDTPVKHYSSGMYVRLAFAVAAHLEPEILVVDEVLAVGDAEFQRKCLGKMQNVSKSEGRTVLFVSHNMSAIESLCNRIIFVNEGKILYDGEAGYGIKVYINHSQNLPHATNIVDRKDRKGNGLAIITDFKICDDSGIITNNLLSGHNYTFEIVYKNVTNENIKNIYVSIDLLDEKGSNVLLFKNTFTNDSISLRKETGSVFCRVDNLPITVGSYSFALYLSIADRETLDYLDNAFSITVTGGDFFGTGNVGVPSNCKVLTKHKWYQ